MFKRFLNSTLLGSVLIFSALASAADLGKQIDFQRNASGEPQFSVKLAYDSYLDGNAWFVSFTVNGHDLSGGKPIKIISWRLWDKKTESFINFPSNFFETANANTLDGSQTFHLGIGFPDKAIEAMALSKRLMLVFFVGSRDAKGAATHFIDLGSYCGANSNQFSNEVSGNTGCGDLQKPTLDKVMPAGNGKIQFGNSSFDSYCTAVKDLSQEIDKTSSALPLGVAGGMKRELNFANNVCGKNGKFTGLAEFKDKDTNTRAIIDLRINKAIHLAKKFIGAWRRNERRSSGLFLSLQTAAFA